MRCNLHLIQQQNLTGLILIRENNLQNMVILSTRTFTKWYHLFLLGKIELSVDTLYLAIISSPTVDVGLIVQPNYQ